MKIIIADCAVALVPHEWKTKKSPPLIDASFHQHFNKDIPKTDRKDRPDILHFGLLTIQGYRKILPHLDLLFQIGTSYYHIDPTTRLPRSQLRFYGVISDLLMNPDKSRLLRSVDQPSLQPEQTIYFSSRGRPFRQSDLTKEVFVFGGFAHGSFRSHYPENSQLVSLVDGPLDLWTSLSYLLNKFVN